MRVSGYIPITCRNVCRPQEPLPSDQPSGRRLGPHSEPGSGSWRGQFQGQFGEEWRSRNSKPGVYLGFSPR